MPLVEQNIVITADWLQYADVNQLFMSGTKNNHVVSQVYLRSFACKEKNGAVYMSSLGDKGWCLPSRPVGIKRVCSFQDFYSIILDGDVDRDTLESQYKQLFEDNWPKVIDRLKSFPFFVYRGNNLARELLFSKQQEVTLIKFLHHQYKKSPRMKAKVVQMNEKLGEEQWAKLDDAISADNNDRERTERVFNHMTFTSFLKQSIEDDTGIIETMFWHKNWIVWQNFTSIPFITTDVPVLWFDELSRGIVKTLFAVISPNYAIEIQSNSEIKRRVFCLHADEEQVGKFNRMMKNYAFSKLVSNNKGVIEALISCG